MIKTEDHKIILSSGREISAYKSILGINHELRDIYEGKDGSLELFSTEYVTTVGKGTEEIEIPNFTPEEITEICDYAIGLWQKMKEKYGVK